MERIRKTYEDMNEIIYAADMDTHELVYLNKRARELYGISSLEQIQGKKCYQFLQNNAAPCAMCTNKMLENEETYQWEYFNTYLKKQFVLKDQMFIHNGRRLRIEIANPVEEVSERHRYHNIDDTSLLINECIRLSLEKTDPQQGIQQMLEFLGTYLLGQRSYIFELSELNQWNNTYEWCADNVTAEIENLQNIPYETTELWNREFQQDHFVMIPDIEEIRESDPEVYQYLSPQNIHSIIVGPLYKKGKICGFYGIDNPPREKIEQVAHMLKTIGHVIDSMIEKRDLVKKLEELSYHDQLSKLGNRFALEKYLYSLDPKQSIGIVYCDVTGLKTVNDTMGHVAGDKLLLLACSCMKDAFEEYELFRIGGDEFLAIASDVEEEKFKQHCSKLKGLMFQNEIHLAMGCVWKPRLDGNPKELIDQADAKMYIDKREYYSMLQLDEDLGQDSVGYVVDEDFNILSVDENAKKIYPMLEKGKKCYQCLKKRDAVCDRCPIQNHITGPAVFFDPIHHNHKTVTAHEIKLEDGRKGYSLVYHSSTSRNEVAAQKYIDTLTGGYTRSGFIREVERFFAHHKNEKRYAMIAVDIQNFKSINDIFGLTGGDKLLTYLYELLKKDNDRIQLVGRLEADWFVCLMERDKLELNRLEKIMSFLWSYEGRSIQVGLHCGIYFIDDDSTPVNSMIERAILAKQSTEKDSLNHFAIFDERMRLDYVSKAEILSSFHRSIQNEEFKVYYQPIIQLSTDHVCAAEALVRWQHSHLGFISPAQFIPVLESNGMITELDHYVLSKVDDYLERLRESDLPLFSVAVNLSWQDFFDQKMVDDVISIASARCMENRRINFELTETSLSALEQNCGYIMKQFQECGSKLLLDDFGSGVSSLGMIGNYSFDIIKIDRSFICQIETNETICNIIRSIIQMCHNIGLKVIGEGVETEKELNFLKEAKCDYVQGFYYARPMPEEQFNQYLSQHGEVNYGDHNVRLAMSMMNQPVLNEDFYKRLLDHVDEFITVVNPEDYSLIYLNETGRKMKGENYQGEKCYYHMERLDQPCGHCVMKNLQYDKTRKLRVGSGDFSLDVNASMWEINGKKVFVEIGCTPQDKNEVEETIQQAKSIVEMLPNHRNILHIDISEDRIISAKGAMKDKFIGKQIDAIVHSLANYIPDLHQQQKFLQLFSKDALLASFARRNYQYSSDVDMNYGGVAAHMRVTVFLYHNPTTNHIECLLYSVNISSDMLKQQEPAYENHLNQFVQIDGESRVDQLTGLKNRLELNEQFMKFDELDIGAYKTVYMIDIDDFKKLNARYGNQVGDQCLRRFGELLNAYGTQNQIRFFRYGGEEFLGIDVSSSRKSSDISSDILDMARSVAVQAEKDQKASFTVSVGYTSGRETLQKMIENADKAMYIAKKKGKNCSAPYAHQI